MVLCLWPFRSWSDSVGKTSYLSRFRLSSEASGVCCKIAGTLLIPFWRSSRSFQVVVSSFLLCWLHTFPVPYLSCATLSLSIGLIWEYFHASPCRMNCWRSTSVGWRVWNSRPGHQNVNCVLHNQHNSSTPNLVVSLKLHCWSIFIEEHNIMDWYHSLCLQHFVHV